MPSHRNLGRPLIRLGTVTSTMDIARRLESHGAAEGTSVIAAAQTHGRGRSDRIWQSPVRTGLYCSILLRPQIPSDRFRPFSVAAGLALCEALDPTHWLGLQLKWPNDILFKEKKLAGILITTSLTGHIVDSAILGIGLNLLPDPTRPETAISLAELDGAFPPFVRTPLTPIFDALSKRYSAIVDSDISAIADWPNRLAYHRQPVTLQDAQTTRTGSLEGLDLAGALILTTTNGPRVITSGDLTRGPSLA